MSSIIGDISGDQPSGADGQTGGWLIPPLWADVIRGDTSVCGLISLKGIPVVLLVICKTLHKMNCSNPLPKTDEKAACMSAYHKRYYAENRERILTWKNDGVQRTPRFSKPVVQAGIKQQGTTR